MTIHNPFEIKLNYEEQKFKEAQYVINTHDAILQDIENTEKSMFNILTVYTIIGYFISNNSIFLYHTFLTFTILMILYGITYKITTNDMGVYAVRVFEIKRGLYYTNINAFLTASNLLKIITLIALAIIGERGIKNFYFNYFTDFIAHMLAFIILFFIIQIDYRLNHKMKYDKLYQILINIRRQEQEERERQNNLLYIPPQHKLKTAKKYEGNIIPLKRNVILDNINDEEDKTNNSDKEINNNNQEDKTNNNKKEESSNNNKENNKNDNKKEEDKNTNNKEENKNYSNKIKRVTERRRKI
ncbi:hypothetical protein SDC9_50166 [bioreactor metagenome]|uniref:Uncharacterized protein n=1 Tax=bioreactor metagenome TaxID=1076179 RepID=A0A644WJW4_9ZZZZ